MTQKKYILNKKNQNKLDDFILNKKGKKTLSKITYINLESGIRKILCLCNKDWDKTTIKDLYEAFETIKKSSTKEQLKSQTKEFFRYCKRNKISDEIIVNFKILTEPTKTNIEVLTPAEINDYINKQENEYDKALAEVFITTGRREKAISNLNWNHVRIINGIVGIYFIKDGKDQEGWVDIIPYPSNPTQIHPKNLIHFWENHKFKNQTNKPLFYSQASHKPYGRTLPNSWCRKCIKMGKKAGIEKHTNPHFLRHTTATYCGNDFTEGLLQGQIGWKKGSKMSTRYVHEGEKNLQRKKLELAGITKEQAEKGIECTKCHEINILNSERCKRCNEPLSLELAYKDLEEKDKRYLLVKKDLDELKTEYKETKKELLNEKDFYAQMVSNTAVNITFELTNMEKIHDITKKYENKNSPEYLEELLK